MTLSHSSETVIHSSSSREILASSPRWGTQGSVAPAGVPEGLLLELRWAAGSNYGQWRTAAGERQCHTSGQAQAQLWQDWTREVTGGPEALGGREGEHGVN